MFYPSPIPLPTSPMLGEEKDIYPDPDLLVMAGEEPSA